ncbi:hypothetical protein CY34DRAFT_807547 [Suillus luteus UH-Slu-Lm8-n1]|uniref:Unplaced genomic scaffold CY34scaffold_184, whole genome shotgun sequence n=1 Tax=Suillus luteus UH-Slu-Lm8-n1 TaxID=930992 RepID=A0A0D0B8Q2_9AGAM|nr:hypothetical protein CY34DRAFT_807547 [Suillus luteus UH-Slu-Lm8-n1]
MLNNCYAHSPRNEDLRLLLLRMKTTSISSCARNHALLPLDQLGLHYMHMPLTLKLWRLEFSRPVGDIISSLALIICHRMISDRSALSASASSTSVTRIQRIVHRHEQ